MHLDFAMEHWLFSEYTYPRYLESPSSFDEAVTIFNVQERTRIVDEVTVKDLRFISNVDSLHYNSIGYVLNIGNFTDLQLTNVVYQSILYTDIDGNPASFSADEGQWLSLAKLQGLPIDATLTIRICAIAQIGTTYYATNVRTVPLVNGIIQVD